MTAWLGVVSADHVARAVELGIGQIGHGTRAGLLRMHRGDTLVYYSPVQHLGDREPLRAFTAIGTVSGDAIWQADEGDVHPFRRAVAYRAAHAVPVEAIRSRLELTASPNWGYQLRRGLIPLSEADVAVIGEAMTAR
ncbi:EVE domain-containing protein [Microbacterium sp. NPDC091313]